MLTCETAGARGDRGSPGMMGKREGKERQRDREVISKLKLEMTSVYQKCCF